jgi:HlyD family secretion protein
VAPTVDPTTRNVQVFVDLAPSKAAKAGMFARGEFALGQVAGLSVPQQAVVLRDGFNFVFVLKPDQRVQKVKVQVGRRSADRIEIREGLAASAEVVVRGAGFLNDGDLVRVNNAVAKAAAPAKATATKPAPSQTKERA